MRDARGHGVEARAIVAARRARNDAPFGSVEELARRAGIGRRALEALAAADAFAGAGLTRRRAAWDARGAAGGPGDLPLFAVARGTVEAAMADGASLQPKPDARLPAQSEGEAVVDDYLATGLTLGRHPLALLRSRLAELRSADTCRLRAARPGSWLRLAGLVLMRQRPGSARGVVFLTVEDEHEVGNLVVYPDVAARDRSALVSGRLLLAEGRVERETEHAEVPITYLIVRRLTDRSDLLDDLLRAEGAPTGDSPARDGGPGDGAWAERGLGHADEVRRPEPGSRRPSRAKLPASRNFR